MTEENRFTAQEIEALADIVAAKVAARLPQHVCQFAGEDVVLLRAWCASSRNAKRTATATLVGALVIGFVTILGVGIAQWVKSLVTARVP